VVGEAMAGMCSEQPTGNNSRNIKPDFSTHHQAKIAFWSSGGERNVVGSQTKLIICLAVISFHCEYQTTDLKFDFLTYKVP